MSDTITISGTDPTNPKRAGDIVIRLDHIRATLDAMHTELGRLQVYASSIRDVLHYDQGVPDKQAGMRAAEVVATIKMLREDMAELNAQTKRAADAVIATRVNLRTRFMWRPSR